MKTLPAPYPTLRGINIVDSGTKRLVFTIRRYDWSSLISWLERNVRLNIVFKEPVFGDDILGDGVVLLTKP